MPTNWPRCTAVQMVLRAYSAKVAGWSFALAESAWNSPATRDTTTPANASAAARCKGARCGVRRPDAAGLSGREL